MKIERMQYHEAYHQSTGMRQKARKTQQIDSDQAIDPDDKQKKQSKHQGAEQEENSDQDKDEATAGLISSKPENLERSLDIVV